MSAVNNDDTKGLRQILAQRRRLDARLRDEIAAKKLQLDQAYEGLANREANLRAKTKEFESANERFRHATHIGKKIDIATLGAHQFYLEKLAVQCKEAGLELEHANSELTQCEEDLRITQKKWVSNGVRIEALENRLTLVKKRKAELHEQSADEDVGEAHTARAFARGRDNATAE